jgi:hypothetical protein
MNAYLRGELNRSSTRKCAASVIIEHSLGYSDFTWWSAMMAYVSGTMTAQDRLKAALMERACGYSLHELYLIEGAFEGKLFTPTFKRQGKRNPEDDITRLERVYALLEQFESLNAGH